MKKLEIIEKIFEEDPNIDIFKILSTKDPSNLTKLCVLNKKYLTNENINTIIKESISYFPTMKDDFGPTGVYDRKYKNIIDLLCVYPEIIKKIPDNITKNIRILDWIDIIQKQPNLINNCSVIDEFKVDNWINIFKIQPKLVDKFINKLKNISIYDWIDILNINPEASKYCNKFDEFKSSHWFSLLRYTPELIDKCNILLEKEETIALLNKYPHLIEKLIIEDIFEIKYESEKMLYNSKNYHINFMEKYIEYYKDSEILTNMIGIYPDLKDLYTKNNLWQYVDFNQLHINLEYSILK